MLSKYIPKHFAEIYADIEKKNFVKVKGTVMFADLSGFTNLSEKLTAKGKEGSEEISRIINEVFEELITIVSRSKGSVYKFGGDAVTVFFPDSVMEKSVLETAIKMQAAVRKFTKIETIAGECSISMKIGIDRGHSAIGRVGNDIKQYFIAGDTLDGACDCEHHAEQGEIIVTAKARAEGSGYEFEKRNGFFKLLTKGPQSGSEAAGKVAPGADKRWFGEFIDNELAERDRAGALEHGELRNCAVVFLNFSGISYGKDFDYGLLNDFFILAAATVKKYQGFINKIDMGDKGNKIIALFGAPVSTEKNEEFALRALQEIRQNKPAGIEIKAGINNGNIYFGLVGASHRQEFTVMGNTVNLSARLMASAKKDEIIISQHIKDRVPEVETGEERKLKLKGVSGLFSAYDLVRVLETRKSKRFKLIGRKRELEEYNAVLKNKKAVLVNVKAEAGLGKSVLVNKLFEDRKKETECCLVNCLSYTKNNTYYAVKEFIAKFAGVTIFDGKKEKIKKLEALLRFAGEAGNTDIFAEFMSWKDKSTSTNDPGLKDFFTEVSLSIFSRVMKERGTVLYLEDAHWLDPASADLFLSLLNVFEPEEFPCFIHFVYRPDNMLAPFENCGSSHTLELNNLEYDEGKQFLLEKFNLTTIPAKIYEQIYQKTKGNPFFMEEILLGLKNDGSLIPDRESGNEAKIVDKFMSERDKALAALEKSSVRYRIKPSIKTINIPDNVNDIVLSRIDKLDENSKMILKIASVIGRIFQFDILKQLQNLKEIADRLDIKDSLFDLTKVDLTIFEETSDNEYLFKHAITQEVAYETLLFSLRRKYHLRIAQLYEKNFGDNISSAYELLAFHYRHTNDKDKARFYLLKSAESAKSKFRFKETFDFLKLYRKYKMPPEEKLESYFLDFDIYRITEKRDKATAVCENIMRSSEKDGLIYQKAKVRQLNILQRSSKYDEAVKLFNSFGNFVNADIKTAALIEIAFVYYRTGDLDKMKNITDMLSKVVKKTGSIKYMLDTECAKGLYYFVRREFGKALKRYNNMLVLADKGKLVNEKFTALRNIASVYGQQGNMDEAEKYFDKLFIEAKKIHNYELVMSALDGLSRVSYIKGDYRTSEKNIKEGIKLVERTGKLHLKELLLQSLFNVRLEQGKYEEALELCRQREEVLKRTGDKIRISVLKDNAGDVYFRKGDYKKAVKIYSDNLEYSQKINNIEMVGHSYGNLANCYAETGDVKKSIEFYEKQIDYSKKHNDIHSEGKALYNLAYTYFEDMKDAKQAEAAALKAEVIFEKIRYKFGLDGVKELLKRIEEFKAKKKEL